MSTTLSEVLPGARTAVGQCLNVGPEDRVFIVTDDENYQIAKALVQAAQERGATNIIVRRLEEFGPRPLLDLPTELVEVIRAARPTVSIFAAASKPGEIRFRIPFGTFMRGEMRVR